MPINEVLKPDAANAIVKKATPACAATNALYLASDYWQDGKQWTGPGVPADIADRDAAIANINADFTPQPLIEDVVDRHVTGLVGREPAFSFVQDGTNDKGEPEEQTVDDADAFITKWFDERNGHEVIQDFATNLVAFQKAQMRIFVPPERLDEMSDGTRQALAANIEEALDLVHFECIEPGRATVQTERASMRRRGIYVYTEVDATDKTISCAETSFIEFEGENKSKTILRIVKDNNETPTEEAFDLDGNLLIYEAERKPNALITDAVRRLQNSLNMMTSMLPRNAKFAGHRGRHGINIKTPMRRITDSTQADGYREEEVAPAVGASTLNLWRAQTYEDVDGNTRTASPQLVFEEPVDSSPIRADIDLLESAILKAVSQLHVKITGDATASAVSRVQARAEFADSLLKTKPKVEGMVRWLIKTAYLFACELCMDTAETERAKAWRVRAEVKANAGPLSPDERRVLIEEYQAGVRSRETVMALTGTEDLDAEIAQMQAEAAQDVTKITEAFTAFSVVLDAPDALMAAIGQMTPEQMAAKLRGTPQAVE